MYILKNAIKNIGRNKGRNILLLSLSLFIITMSVVSMMLNDYANKSADYYRSTYGSRVTIVESKKDEIDKEILLSFTESSLLSKSEKRATVRITGNHLKVLDDDKTQFLKWSAISDFEVEETFESGEKKIIEGKHISKSNEVIISKRLAELNNLKVGDHLTIGEQDKVLLTIVGIYNNVSLHANENPSGDSYTNVWNEIYTNWETMKESPIFKEKATCSIDLYLKKPADISLLRTELLQKGMPESYILTQDLETYKEKMQPVYQLQDISYKLMYGVIGVGGILLILISVMGVRERKYEVGVLRAIGMYKHHIARGFLYESFMMTTIALLISLIISVFCIVPITMNMLIGTHLSEMIHVTLSYKDILYSTFLSLTLALISSLGGLFVIMRYSPRRIITEKD